jgi:hypothetical protein
MRRLAKNEQRLLILFGAAVFLALNLLAIRLWIQNRSALMSQITQTRSAISTGESWIHAAEALQPAREWIEKNPAPTGTGDQASTNLLNSVRSLAEKSNLKLPEETFLPSENSPAGESAVLQVKLTGPFSGVASFLFELQNPTAWRAIDKMMIRSDNEPPNVIVDLVVRQYYRAPSDAAPATGP